MTICARCNPYDEYDVFVMMIINEYNVVINDHAFGITYLPPNNFESFTVHISYSTVVHIFFAEDSLIMISFI